MRDVTQTMSRVETFIRTGKLTNEGVENAMIDMASFAIIMLVLFREKNGANALAAMDSAEPEVKSTAQMVSDIYLQSKFKGGKDVLQPATPIGNSATAG
jgi:hypothetical protein